MALLAFFVMNESEIDSGKYIFVATGTGISPFQSFVRTHPKIKYHLFHGIRYSEENYGKEVFPIIKRTICTSRDSMGNYAGRVSSLLADSEIDIKKIYYLCGNSQMINDVAGLLEEAGVPIRNIRSEVFF